MDKPRGRNLCENGSRNGKFERRGWGGRTGEGRGGDGRGGGEGGGGGVGEERRVMRGGLGAVVVHSGLCCGF